MTPDAQHSVQAAAGAGTAAAAQISDPTTGFVWFDPFWQLLPWSELATIAGLAWASINITLLIRDKINAKLSTD